MNILDFPDDVIANALGREKEVLQERLDETDCPHEGFDLSVLMAVIDEALKRLHK